MYLWSFRACCVPKKKAKITTRFALDAFGHRLDSPLAVRERQKHLCTETDVTVVSKHLKCW